MKMNEKDLGKVAGGFQTAELKDGSFVIIADQAKRYSSADEAAQEISKIEENIQMGRPQYISPRCHHKRLDHPNPHAHPPVAPPLPVGEEKGLD